MRKIILTSLILTFIISSCDFFQSKNLFSDNEDTLMLYKKKQDSLRFVDSIKELQGQLNSIRKRHKSMLDSIKKAQGTEATKSEYKFHIIVGSFKNPEYLKTYNQYIKEKGFKTRVLRNKYGFNLISVESTNSWNSAVSTLQNIRNDVEKDAWIYIES